MKLQNKSSFRPKLEHLEDRLAPTTLTVRPPATLPAAAHVPVAQVIGAAASAAQATAHSGGVVVIK
jgi:hypothetical protein